MSTDLIAVAEYCRYHHIEPAFVLSLSEEGIITLTYIEQEHFIPYAQLQDLERYIHWHYELEINLEGIDVIRRLLEKNTQMQRELAELRERVRVFEGMG